jgi:hypothetical protein
MLPVAASAPPGMRGWSSRCPAPRQSRRSRRGACSRPVPRCLRSPADSASAATGDGTPIKTERAPVGTAAPPPKARPSVSCTPRRLVDGVGERRSRGRVHTLVYTLESASDRRGARNVRGGGARWERRGSGRGALGGVGVGGGVSGGGVGGVRERRRHVRSPKPDVLVQGDASTDGERRGAMGANVEAGERG